MVVHVDKTRVFRASSKSRIGEVILFTSFSYLFMITRMLSTVVHGYSRDYGCYQRELFGQKAGPAGPMVRCYPQACGGMLGQPGRSLMSSNAGPAPCR